MKNTIKSFQLFVRPDEKSLQIANDIRELNSKNSIPLIESEDADLVIAIGGDGTFIDAVTNTRFSQDKVYTGIHTGTLGFMQDLSANDIFSLIQYINFEKELNVRKVYISSVEVSLKNGEKVRFFSLNEVIIGGRDYSRICFSEYIGENLLQNVSGNGIVLASNTGDTAYSMNAGGAIDFSGNLHLTCTHIIPITNAACENYLANTITCTKMKIVVKPASNIIIVIDGRKKEIDSELIESVKVSTNKSNYIQKLDLVNYSKVRVVREKILGY